MMSTRMIYTSMMAWFAMVTALVGFALFAVPMTLAAGAAALAVSLMPPAIMLRLRVPAEAK